MRQQLRYLPLLLLTAFIWGSAFVAQSLGGEALGPFTFNAARSFIGAAALAPAVPLARRLAGGAGRKMTPRQKRDLARGGAVCGLALGVASGLQQWGIGFASVGKAGFVTAMYIVLVPVLGLFFGRRPGARVWLAVALAAAGLYLLCWSGPGGLGPGDWLLLGCSAVFSLHILAVDHFSPLAEGVSLSCLQFFVAGCVCLVPALLFERAAPADFLAAAGPLAWAGVLSCGVAYTLQVIAQRHVDPTLASLVLSLESVFSVLAGWAVLGEELTGRQLAGCALAFGAILLAQLPGRAKDK